MVYFLKITTFYYILCFATETTVAQGQTPGDACKMANGVLKDACSAAETDVSNTTGSGGNTPSCPMKKCCVPKPVQPCGPPGGICQENCYGDNNDIYVYLLGYTNSTGCKSPLGSCCVKRDAACKQANGVCKISCSALLDNEISNVKLFNGKTGSGCSNPEKPKCCSKKPAQDCVAAGGTCRRKCDAINDNEIVGIKAGVNATGCSGDTSNCCVKKEGKSCMLEKKGSCKAACASTEAPFANIANPRVVDCPYDKTKMAQMLCCGDKDVVCKAFGGECKTGPTACGDALCPAKGFGLFTIFSTYPNTCNNGKACC